MIPRHVASRQVRQTHSCIEMSAHYTYIHLTRSFSVAVVAKGDQEQRIYANRTRLLHSHIRICGRRICISGRRNSGRALGDAYPRAAIKGSQKEEREGGGKIEDGGGGGENGEAGKEL